ncbi:hypothetical protein [Nocardia cyriacigeorgica]|nr:hypothetical protein [Nocardia cyriacigeorgica]
MNSPSNCSELPTGSIRRGRAIDAASQQGLDRLAALDGARPVTGRSA